MNKQAQLAIALIQLGRSPEEAARFAAHPTAAAALSLDTANVAVIAAELHTKPPIESDTAVFDEIRARARARNKPSGKSAAERLGMLPR